MDSDDDYQSFSPPKEPSPQVHYRRLKRLKKSNIKPANSPLSQPIDEPLLFPSVDFAKSETLENDSETLNFNDLNSKEDSNLSSQESLSLGIDNDNEEEKDDEMEFGFGEEVKKTKRVLEFDDDVITGVGNGEENVDFEKENKSVEEHLIEKKGNVDFEKGNMSGEEHLIQKKEDKKKRLKSGSDDEMKVEERPLNKRREKKERQANLKKLHAETQRLLRETRDAAFKPIPLVNKPISSVLEKIRKRKLEISKKSIIGNNRSNEYEENSTLKDNNMDLDFANEERSEENMAEAVEKETTEPCVDGTSSIDECKGAAIQSHENDQEQISLDEVPTPAFRAPVDDTQDLFDDSEPNGTSAEQLNSPLEEEFAPSLPAMNLTLDSAPVDDSSDEENDDKENIDPRPRGNTYSSSSPKGDPVKNFLDDEAEEEDDSDNDLKRFKENEEDEDIEDLEELNDMIATEYEERPVDKERRNELHQKWLEQQDATGTDNLLQRFKYGSELRDKILPEEEPESDEDEGDDDELDDETKDDNVPKNSARLNTKKAKQIILQLFSEKEDVYLSDDDEDTHRRRAHHLLIRKEEQTTLVSPADDENSREVFGLIKKLNIVSDNKKKPKPSLFFDSLLKGGNNNCSSKSSFLGRASNHSIPSSHKQGSATFRSFIFGRDDSNSRSSISLSEDSSDTVSEEIRPTRNITAKYSNSQTKFNDQNRNASEETASRTSLLEILKRPSLKPQVCHQQNTVDLTKSIFAFRAPKKPVKIEGRS